MFYRRVLRPLLFLQDPETAHERTLELLARINGVALRTVRPFSSPRLRLQVAGLQFPNPVGLAAGCDKNGRAIAVWPHFGFGFVEIGTVTVRPQSGNPKPRLFRVPEHGALINCLGFNSEGSEAVARRLAWLRRQRRPLLVPLGINLGKNRQVTGYDETLEDYRTGFRRLARFADFVVLNVSSPNTPGLRQWQERERLDALLEMLCNEASALASRHNSRPTPIFVKISPDMPEPDVQDVAEVAVQRQIAGIIATNTTLERPEALAGVPRAGGLSGRPLRDRATAVVRLLYRLTRGQLPIIGVGGISTPEDAYARLQAGASLVQLYTALVYEGPYLPQHINQGLLRLMDRDGVQHLSEIIGVHAQ